MLKDQQLGKQCLTPPCRQSFLLGNHALAPLQVCLAAVGLVGDLCRALQSSILPFCDEVMQLLLENLGVSE